MSKVQGPAGRLSPEKNLERGRALTPKHTGTVHISVILVGILAALVALVIFFDWLLLRI